MLLFCVTFNGCGLYDDTDLDGYDDTGEDCNQLCETICENCHSSYGKQLQCNNYCEPKCSSHGCDYSDYSSSCDEIFMLACNLE